MTKRSIVAFVLALGLMLTVLSGCSNNSGSALPQFDAPKSGSEVAVVATNQGTMKFVLYPDLAPEAVAQFKTLVEAGFYNNAPIGRLINNYFFETTTGKAASNLPPVADEYSMKLWHFTGALGFTKDLASNASNELYVVSATSVPADVLKLMEEIEEDSRGRYPDDVLAKYKESGGFPELDGRYAIFGQLYEGFDVLAKINASETEFNEETQEQSKPVAALTVTGITFEKVE